jgi:hypothetical protein
MSEAPIVPEKPRRPAWAINYSVVSGLLLIFSFLLLDSHRLFWFFLFIAAGLFGVLWLPRFRTLLNGWSGLLLPPVLLMAVMLLLEYVD